MAHAHKKMVTWIDYEHDPNRVPKPNTLIHMVIDYEVCLGFYDPECGFQRLPVECRFSNHFNSQSVTPKFWAYPPKHPFET